MVFHKRDLGLSHKITLPSKGDSNNPGYLQDSGKQVKKRTMSEPRVLSEESL